MLNAECYFNFVISFFLVNSSLSYNFACTRSKATTLSFALMAEHWRTNLYWVVLKPLQYCYEMRTVGYSTRNSNSGYFASCSRF